LALAGGRDIRDCLKYPRPEDTGADLAGLYNIANTTKTLPNFTLGEAGELCRQHTEATGQIFEKNSIRRAWLWTEGQPWLLSALAREVTENQLKNDFSVKITGRHFDEAAETLIKGESARNGFLLERLGEDRARRAMEAVITGEGGFSHYVDDDDIQYVLDLGILKKASHSFLPASPICQKASIRAISGGCEAAFSGELELARENHWADGSKINMTALVKAFQAYWRHNSEKLKDPSGYGGAAPLLAASAYFQTI
jgi:hypothetical protein